MTRLIFTIAVLLAAPLATAQPTSSPSPIPSARQRANPPSPASAASPSLCPGLAGPEALACVADGYRPARVLSLAASKDRLYDTVDRTSRDGADGVAGLYTDHFVPFDCDPDCDPSKDVYNGDGSYGINQEHLWPRAEGADGNAAERDLHHLVPTRGGVNSARGNLPFAEVPDPSASAWYALDRVQSAPPPPSDRDRWSERQGSATAAAGGRWEPRESVKGDVARALFYVAAVYADVVDLAWFEPQVETLLVWHRADPPTEAEAARSERVAAFQSGCAAGPCVNPFVADATLADRAFGEAEPAVALASFTAEPDGAGARVAWTTVEEVAISRFLVEGRSDTFGSTWTRWAEVDAEGVPRPYAVRLAGAASGGPIAPGVYRVRLLAHTAPATADGPPGLLDLGDVGLTVGTATADTERPDAPAFTLSPPTPNPTAATVRVVLTASRPARVLAAVYDGLGREVAVAYDGIAHGHVEIAIDTTRLAPGSYLLRAAVLDGSDTASQRFTVAH